MIGNKESFGVVIVTYNRLEKLKKALLKIETQSVLPEYIIIVNNASSDGTESYLCQWRDRISPFMKIVINKEMNDGGSGGFFTALEKAQDLNAEWIYVSDDDAFPCEKAFETFKSFISSFDTSNTAAICASVIQYGHISLEHRRNLKEGIFAIKELSIPIEEYEKPFFYLSLYSFVGVFLNKEKMIKAGLPRKEYFIQWDDTEHSIRMGKQGEIICVPSIQVEHELEYSKTSGYQWKDYYGIRNRMDGIRRNFSPKYTVVIYLKRIADLAIAWLKPDKEFAKLFTDAVFDAFRGKLGIHSVYKPGWKPAKDNLHDEK